MREVVDYSRYKEVRRGGGKHPSAPCPNEQPFFLAIIEHSPYSACNNCNTAWVSRIKDVRTIGRFQYAALEK